MKWQTLAPELIYEVLSQFRGEFKTLSISKPHTFPWYLGHVCSAWREVFVSSPQFWNTLAIDLDLSGDQRQAPDRMLEVTRISMIRSKETPISFSLKVGRYYSPRSATMDVLQQVVEVLVANSPRWHSAYIYVPANVMATIYAAKNRIPLLRAIRLTLQTGMIDGSPGVILGRDAAEKYCDFLMDAPQLTRIFFDDIFPLWNINWSLITVIHFCTVAILNRSQLLAYLSQMPSLTELVFHSNLERKNISSDEIIPVTLVHLKILHCSTVRFLQMLETPALQELYMGRNDMADKSTLNAIISRYFQPIRHLQKLAVAAYDWKDVSPIIEHMPRVDHLTIFSGKPVDLLKALEGYQRIRLLKTVKFSLCINEAVRDNILETVTSWTRKSGENKGIGPFDNLTQMFFRLWNGDHQRLADSLKLHVEEQGIRCSINEPILGTLDPRFDVL